MVITLLFSTKNTQNGLLVKTEEIGIINLIVRDEIALFQANATQLY